MGTYIGTVKASETSKDEIIKMMVGRDMSEQYPKDPTEKGEIALKVENLTYTPPEGSFRRSLKNISLYVRHGEVLGIAGLAGAGRSELFECLAGVHYKDTTAKIFIDGKEVIIKNPADAIKAGISFATEDRKGTGLVLQRSIGENMSLPLLKNSVRHFYEIRGREKRMEQTDGNSQNKSSWNEDSRQCAFRRKSAEGCTWKMVDDGTENSSSG